MNPRLVTIGLFATAALATGLGLMFRPVVQAVAAAEGSPSALAQLERALDQTDARPAAAPGPDDAAEITAVVVAGPDGAADAGPGFVVTHVVPDSPAAAAGIARGDIVLAVDGDDVATRVDLRRALDGRPAGETARLTVQHGDDVRDVTLTLADGGWARLGLAACGGALPHRIAVQRLGAGGAAVVESVTAGGPAAAAGLQPGDRITAVDGEKLGGDTIVFRHRIERDGHGGLHRFFSRWFGRGDDEAAAAAENGEGAAPAAPAEDDVLVPAPAAGADPVLVPLPDMPGAGEVVARGGPSLADVIGRHTPGDRVTLTVEREGEAARDVEVVLGTHPDNEGRAFLGVRYAAIVDHSAVVPGMPGLPMPGAVWDDALVVPAAPAAPAEPAAPGAAPARDADAPPSDAD